MLKYSDNVALMEQHFDAYPNAPACFLNQVFRSKIIFLSKGSQQFFVIFKAPGFELCRLYFLLGLGDDRKPQFVTLTFELFDTTKSIRFRHSDSTLVSYSQSYRL